MCLNPQYAIIPSDGSQAIFGYKQSLKEHVSPLPCGKCHICISKRSLEWATRARHEMAEHQESSFITLTYNPEHITSDQIVYSDFQKLMYKLRKQYPKQLRYMVSCEYGENYKRPHFHFLLFGLNPPNQKLVKITPKGSKLYTSDLFSDLWKKGFHSVGQANEATAYYVASYALSSSRHQILIQDGEIIDVQDTMKSSNRPAIGYTHFLKHYESIVHAALAQKKPLPRYYVKKLKEFDYPLWELYKTTKESDLKIRSIHSDYAKILEFQSKNSIADLHDRKIKDFTYLKEKLKNEVQITNAFIKGEKNAKTMFDL